MLAITHRRWLRVSLLSVLAFVNPLLLGQPAFAQRLFWDSAGSLPGNISRVEYENLKALRRLPNFVSLRNTYTTKTLRDLNQWLGLFGLKEDDIDELLVGLGGGTGLRDFVIASGEFDPTLPAGPRSSASELAATKIGEETAYCKGPYGGMKVCAMFKGQGWVALGSKEFLSYVARGGDGVIPPLSPDSEFMELTATVPTHAAIWGLARGWAAGAWLRSYIPFGESASVVWPGALREIDGLTYGITPDRDELHLAISIQCKSSSGASALGIALETVKGAQSVSWLLRQPGRSDPFTDVHVGVDGRSVLLGLTASYDAVVDGEAFRQTQGRR